jgi:SAM-dependent methyltransferase
MYRSLRGKLQEDDSSEKTCLAISDSVWFGNILGLAKCKYTSAIYPEQNILRLPYRNDTFDFVISDQVFEHIEGDPFVAFKETARVLRAGGILCHTTCFINEIHGVPKDFWRFTPDALALLSRSAQCNVLEIGSWGNREAWALINAGFRFSKIPDDETHPLYRLAIRNEPAWPIVTWVIARKE